MARQDEGLEHKFLARMTLAEKAMVEAVQAHWNETDSFNRALRHCIWDGYAAIGGDPRTVTVATPPIAGQTELDITADDADITKNDKETK